jgi:hypothetical protein
MLSSADTWTILAKESGSILPNLADDFDSSGKSSRKVFEKHLLFLKDNRTL